MRRVNLGAALGLVLVGLGLAAPTPARESPDAARRCSISTSLGPVRASQPVMLVEPLADSARAFLHELDWNEFGYVFERVAAPADSTWGRVFRVIAVSQGTDRVSVQPGDEIVAVPWEYDASCVRTLWTEPLLAWAGPERQVFLHGRARGHAGGDRPVIDVMGWHDPYPSADFLSGSNRPPRDEWLSADVYFDLLAALPRSPRDRSTYDAFMVELRAAAEAWFDAHPEHADRFPATVFHDRPRPGR